MDCFPRGSLTSDHDWLFVSYQKEISRSSLKHFLKHILKKNQEYFQFSKLSLKTPKIPENSWISGEVETLASGGGAAAKMVR